MSELEVAVLAFKSAIRAQADIADKRDRLQQALVELEGKEKEAQHRYNKAHRLLVEAAAK